MNVTNQELLRSATPPDFPLVVGLEAAGDDLALLGGKGASLARLAAAGLPVPPGFVVTTAAYRWFVVEHGLQQSILERVAGAPADDPAALEAASGTIAALFARHRMPAPLAEIIRAAYAGLASGDPAVAVRSSATAEDLPGLSFAGQQDSYLNIHGEDPLLESIKRCWASLWTARAIGYRARHGIAQADVSLAVVVQELVPAEASGVLFTVNPLGGAAGESVINATWGLGEALVGGQVTPDTYVVDRADGSLVSRQIGTKDVMTVRAGSGTHESPVPPERRALPVLSQQQAAELARLGARIERLYGRPMDIEWALSAGRLAIVQARPITTLPAAAPDAEIWNDSLDGDFLWTSGNVGEAVPDVMTPCTWSLIQIFIGRTMAPLYAFGYPPVGNIGGRFYLNLSVTATMAALVGIRGRRFVALQEEVFGRIPESLAIPLLPGSRWKLLRALIPAAARLQRRVRANQRRLPEFIAAAPARCEALRAHIAAAPDSRALIALWHEELLPFFEECCDMLEAGARRDNNAIVRIRGTLRRIVGAADAGALLSGLNSESEQLASLGPLLGLQQLAAGAIDRPTFARQYGHRGPHEFEVSLPRPAEDPAWIDRQLAGLRAAPRDVAALLARQRQAQEDAWQRLQQRYPRKAPGMRRRIERAAAGFRDREAARSEVVRVFWALRDFVLRAGALSGAGEALFFLSIDEILALLAGDAAALSAVPARRAAYERYRALPPYPTLIRGRFDPFAWAADPQRRGDLFDAAGRPGPQSDVITGFPGASGVVIGQARVLASADDGDQLRPGEILVTTVTNVGWTPLFPRAAAIVTDVGAPLSHAAIVARELGIPAVVGCGNATMRLRTGDRLRVDGGRGTVEVLPEGDG